MRSILVGVVAMVVAAGSPAYGGSVAVDTERRPQPATEPAVIEPAPSHEHLVVHQRAPFREVVEEDTHSAGSELGMGVASTILSIFYTPVRLTVGIAGAAVGGFEGWATGGNLRTARSMWRPTVEGDYFIRPDHLDRTEHYEFSNVRPVAHERYTLYGRQVVVRPEETVASIPPETVAPADEVPIPPAHDDMGDDR